MNQTQIDALNREFGIPNLVEVLSGNDGLPKIRVTAPSASAEIYLHGAQLTSWQPVNAEEVLFLSEHSNWQDGRAIRGGIPVCFPWFRSKADDLSAPAHGVVRTKEWQLESVTESPSLSSARRRTMNQRITGGRARFAWCTNYPSANLFGLN